MQLVDKTNSTCVLVLLKQFDNGDVNALVVAAGLFHERRLQLVVSAMASVWSTVVTYLPNEAAARYVFDGDDDILWCEPRTKSAPCELPSVTRVQQLDANAPLVVTPTPKWPSKNRIVWCERHIRWDAHEERGVTRASVLASLRALCAEVRSAHLPLQQHACSDATVCYFVDVAASCEWLIDVIEPAPPSAAWAVRLRSVGERSGAVMATLSRMLLSALACAFALPVAYVVGPPPPPPPPSLDLRIVRAGSCIVAGVAGESASNIVLQFLHHATPCDAKYGSLRRETLLPELTQLKTNNTEVRNLIGNVDGDGVSGVVSLSDGVAVKRIEVFDVAHVDLYNSWMTEARVVSLLDDPRAEALRASPYTWGWSRERATCTCTARSRVQMCCDG